MLAVLLLVWYASFRKVAMRRDGSDQPGKFLVLSFCLIGKSSSFFVMEVVAVAGTTRLFFLFLLPFWLSAPTPVCNLGSAS